MNDGVLRMQEVQESILSLSFSRQIPKSISEEINNYLEKNADKGDKGENGKYNGSNRKNQEEVKTKIKTKMLPIILISLTPIGDFKMEKTSLKFSTTDRKSVPRRQMGNLCARSFL